MQNFNKTVPIAIVIFAITMLFVFSGCASFWKSLLDDTDGKNTNVTASNDSESNKDTSNNTSGKNTNVTKKISSNNVDNSIKYNCSTLTADQLFASIKDPENPTVDELYRTFEASQCCKIKPEEDFGDFIGIKSGCILNEVSHKIEDKTNKDLYDLLDDVIRKLPEESYTNLINRMANSNTPLVRGTAYILISRGDYGNESERVQFINNAIIREQNAKTDEELYAYWSILAALADGHFVSTLTPEIKQYLDDTTHHKVERVKRIANKLCNKNGELCYNFYKDKGICYRYYNDTDSKKSNNVKKTSSKDVGNSVKYNCSTLTADQLLASIKNPAKPTDNDLYLLYESLQCCTSLRDQECVFIQVVEKSEKIKGQAIYNEINSLSTEYMTKRKTLFNKMLNSKTALVRAVPYREFYSKLYKSYRQRETLKNNDEEILFVKNAIQREKNPQTETDLSVFSFVTAMIWMLGEVTSHQDWFNLFCLPEIRSHLSAALHHKDKDIRENAERACQSGGQGGKQLCDELLKSEPSH